MNRLVIAFAASAALLFLGPASAQAPPAFTPGDESVEDQPAGHGREETFGMCSACHAYRLVASQGMTREKWDETLVWMTDKHNLPKLEEADRTVILDYLALAHPPRAPSRSGGFRNPFAPQ